MAVKILHYVEEFLCSFCVACNYFPWSYWCAAFEDLALRKFDDDTKSIITKI